MKAIVTLALTLCLIVAAAAAPNSRTWTEASTGRTLDGVFVKMDGGIAIIARSNGTTVKLPLARLTDEDREFIKAQTSPDKGSEAKADKVSGNEVTLSGVHLCCGGCEKGIEKAVAEEDGIELDVSRGGKTVTVSASSTRMLQRAMNLIAEAGYYGESNHESVAIAVPDASDKETDKVSVKGLHLCCGACVKAVGRALEGVEGYSGNNAEKGSETFQVEGDDITETAVLEALRTEGLFGKRGYE